MMWYRKLWNIKIFIKRVFYFLIILIYQFSSLRSQAQAKHIQFGLISAQSTIYVDTTVDSNAEGYQICSDHPNDCTLRGAISKANQSPGQEFHIELPDGIYNLLLPGAEENNNHTGDLDIYGHVIIDGARRSTTQIDGNALDRVFEVHDKAIVILQDLTITDGLTPPGLDGGGIYNNGNLTITENIIAQNATGAGLTPEECEPGGDGGSGGGIYNGGILHIQNSQIYSNTTGSGGDGFYRDWNYPDKDCYGGDGGDGGAIFNTGYLLIIQTHVFENAAGDGGRGGDVPLNYFEGDGGNGGDGGDGGGIYSINTLKIYESNISGNHTGMGGSAGRGWYLNYGRPGNSGSGGGLYSSSILMIEDSVVNANHTGSGAWPGWMGGNGGGIYTQSGTAKMLSSQVKLNFTGPGGPAWNWGGSGGDGGGIYNQQGVWILDDVAVSGNQTGKGETGNQGGNGAGIYNAGTFTINSSLVQDNQTGIGGEGLDAEKLGQIDASSGGMGGGIFNKGELSIIYSQVENNGTGYGGNSPEDYLKCGSGGQGGGILNQGTIQIMYSHVNYNKTGNNGLGGYDCEGGRGGGLYNSGEISIAFSSIFSNTTGDGDSGMNSGSGGGIFNNGSLFLDGVQLSENQVGQNGSGGFGGGAYIAGDSSIAFHNTLIADNHMIADGLGSGIYADTVTLNLLHTTLARNTGGDGSGLHTLDATLTLTNTILVSHTVGINASAGSIIKLDTTMWGSGSWANLLDLGGSGTITHTNNLTGTPGFVNPDMGDYHLSENSDARDMGITFGIETKDMDNQPRPNPDTGLPDLGSDEYWPPVLISTVDITAPLSATAYTSVPFAATVKPILATPNVYFVWMPTPDTGQGTNMVTYAWHEPGQKTVQVTALNAYSSVLAVWEIPIFAAEFKVFIPNIYLSR